MPLRVTDGLPILPQPGVLDEEVDQFILDTVPRFQQLQDAWCWAACAQMVLHFYGLNAITQCNIVNSLFNAGCCHTPDSSTCDRGCADDDIFDIYSNFGVQAQPLQQSVDFVDLQLEINAQRPVEVCYKWNDTDQESAHVVIVRGWRFEGNKLFLFVHDPLPGSPFGGKVRFAQMLLAHGHGHWALTWVDLRV